MSGDGKEDLRERSGVRGISRLHERTGCLQADMPSFRGIVDDPSSTAELGGRPFFPRPAPWRVSRDAAARELALCFPDGAGLTIPGELARVTGCRGGRPDGNRALVSEGFAVCLAGP